MPKSALGMTKLDLAERMEQPGATTSGLMRWSRVGPRPLKAKTPFGLSEIGSEAMGLTVNCCGAIRLYVICASSGRMLSEAPTEMQFFAVLGGPTEPEVILPVCESSAPSFPTAKQMTRSRCSQTNLSTSRDCCVYMPWS